MAEFISTRQCVCNPPTKACSRVDCNPSHWELSEQEINHRAEFICKMICVKLLGQQEAYRKFNWIDRQYFASRDITKRLIYRVALSVLNQYDGGLSDSVISGKFYSPSCVEKVTEAAYWKYIDFKVAHYNPTGKP